MSYIVGDHVVFAGSGGPAGRLRYHRFRCCVVALADRTDCVYVAIVKALNRPDHEWVHGETFLCNLMYLQPVPALELLAEAAG